MTAASSTNSAGDDVTEETLVAAALNITAAPAARDGGPVNAIEPAAIRPIPIGLWRQPRAQLGASRSRSARTAASTAPIVLLVALYVVYNCCIPRGFSHNVFSRQCERVRRALAFVAMAQAMAVLTGGLDLSVGAVMTLDQSQSPANLCGASPGSSCSAASADGAPPAPASASSTASSSSMAGSSRSLRRSPPAPSRWASPCSSAPQPGGKVDADLNWADDQLDQAILAETYQLFEDGERRLAAADRLDPGAAASSSSS